MSGPSQFQASGPLPSASFASWDAQTEQQALWNAAGGSGGGGSAVGPAGAIQYSSGAGAFLGVIQATTDATGNINCASLATVGLCAVGGAATVAGTLTTAGTATIGAGGSAALAAGATTVASLASSGAISGSTLSVASAGRYLNASAINQAPGAVGFSGSRQYTVACGANTNNIDIGLSALINDSVPHLFSVNVRANESPFAAHVVIGLVQSFPAPYAIAPILTAATTGNGYALTAVTGTPGAYALSMNSSLGVATTAAVNITIIY